MSTTSVSHPAPVAGSQDLRAENEALRERIQQLEAAQDAAAWQKARDERYEQSQARFRAVFENSPLGQKIITSDLVIREANPALAAMLGCADAQAVVGRRIMEFAHPHFRLDWTHLQERLWAHRIAGFSFETCLVRADGSSFWCQVYSVLFCDGEEELGYTTLIDISAQKELEDSLKRVSDSQETMVQLVAHDLKAPIANIQLLGELLRREADAPNAETPKLLDLIDQSCDEAYALLKDVLYLGELEARRLPKTPTDFGAFLDAQLAVHRVAAQAKGLTLTLELPPHPVTALLHPEKFGRVVANLLTNALKFTPAGGQVTVRLTEPDGRPRLQVQDTGVGIAPALQKHLFDKFSAAARQGLAGEETTGLGLFITQQIVRLHGGTIGVESREHEGTTFTVDLP